MAHTAPLENDSSSEVVGGHSCGLQFCRLRFVSNVKNLRSGPTPGIEVLAAGTPLKKGLHRCKPENNLTGRIKMEYRNDKAFLQSMAERGITLSACENQLLNKKGDPVYIKQPQGGIFVWKEVLPAGKDK